jgi:hypothetical protein
MHIYEYLFTAIIIFAMLIASSTIVITISQPQTTITDKEQLKITAQKIMTQLTLDPGDPPDWGSDITITPNTLTTFGLAKYGETTREAYVLDPDKVLRLDTNNPLYIPPNDVINLLNLAPDYGLKIEINPALNVTVTNTTNTDTYKVTVTTNDIGFPIANAEVTARIFYLNSTTQKITSKPSNTNTTLFDGKCQFNFGTIPEPKVLVLAVNYYGIRIVRALPIGTVVTQTYLIGNHTLLDGAYTIVNDEATEIIAEPTTDGYMIQNVTSPVTQIDTTTFDLNYLEPSTVAIMAVADGGTALLFASKEATLTYSSIPGAISFPFSYSLERTVTIGGSAYIMSLTIWRMSF